MLLQLLLVTLEGGGCVGVRQNVALDQRLAVGSLGEALLEVVGGALSLELECLSLQSSVCGGYVSIVVAAASPPTKQNEEEVEKLKKEESKGHTGQLVCLAECACS